MDLSMAKSLEDEIKQGKEIKEESLVGDQKKNYKMLVDNGYSFDGNSGSWKPAKKPEKIPQVSADDRCYDTLLGLRQMDGESQEEFKKRCIEHGKKVGKKSIYESGAKAQALGAEQLYYLWSKKWTNGHVRTFWRPNDKGYTINLDEAGTYTKAGVESNRAFILTEDNMSMKNLSDHETYAIAVEDIELLGKKMTCIQY